MATTDRLIDLNVFATKEDVEELKIYFRAMAMQNGLKTTMDISDVAGVEGVSVSFIKQADNRYLLPRFVESAYPTGPVRWTIEEYVAWRRKDPHQRQAEYRALVSKKRKEASNIA